LTAIETAATAHNLFDLERAAEARLEAVAFSYLAGGADGGRTLQANRDAFADHWIRARRLVDVREIDTSLELLGARLASPILLAPVGFLAFFHPEGELACARAGSGPAITRGSPRPRASSIPA
jgi:isopentenyl diphosphate isomerase/L-lactate dehydrogenase-like FMN-dependent dehydrogenase